MGLAIHKRLHRKRRRGSIGRWYGSTRAPDLNNFELFCECGADALLAMTAETMIPEAFHNSPRFSGLLAAFGFGLLLLVDATTPRIPLRSGAQIVGSELRGAMTYKLAERVGFEPTCPFGQDAFEAPPLRPLRYLSVIEAVAILNYTR